MNKIINILSLMCLVVPFAYGAKSITERSGVFKDNIALLTSPYRYSKAGDFGLEISNETGKPLWYAIKNGDDFSDLFMSRPIVGKAVPKQYTIDINKPTTLALWFTQPQDFSSRGLLTFRNKEWAFNPDPDKVITFTKGKTINIMVDSSRTVRPESGPMRVKGGRNRTESGTSLENNVRVEDIQTIK